MECTLLASLLRAGERGRGERNETTIEGGGRSERSEGVNAVGARQY